MLHCEDHVIQEFLQRFLLLSPAAGSCASVSTQAASGSASASAATRVALQSSSSVSSSSSSPSGSTLSYHLIPAAPAKYQLPSNSTSRHTAVEYVLMLSKFGH